MQRTLTSCSITKHSHTQIIGSTILFRKSNTGTYWNLSPNNPITTKIFIGIIKEVHRASFALHNSSSFTKQLSHCFVRRYPTANSSSVLAIRCYNSVVFSNCGFHPRRYSFLPNIHMTKATYFLLTVHPKGHLFKFTDTKHQCIPLNMLFSRIRYLLSGRRFLFCSCRHRYMLI